MCVICTKQMGMPVQFSKIINLYSIRHTYSSWASLDENFAAEER